MYKVLHYFTDSQDENRAYHTGDTFPREGMTVSDERIAELSSKNNKLGIPLIGNGKTEPKAEVAEEEKPKPKRTAKKKG